MHTPYDQAHGKGLSSGARTWEAPQGRMRESGDAMSQLPDAEGVGRLQ